MLNPGDPLSLRGLQNGALTGWLGVSTLVVLLDGLELALRFTGVYCKAVGLPTSVEFDNGGLMINSKESHFVLSTPTNPSDLYAASLSLRKSLTMTDFQGKASIADI